MMTDKGGFDSLYPSQDHQQGVDIKDGVVITAKLAQLAGVKVGQSLEN